MHSVIHLRFLTQVLATPILLSLLFAVSACGAETPTPNNEWEPANWSIDNTPIQQTSQSEVVSYADTLATATPSVVAVYTASFVINEKNPRGIEELFRRYGFPVPETEQPNPNTPRERRRNGVGSGVIVSANGYIVTNHHVITDRQGNRVDEIRIQLADGSEHSATVVGSDAPTDIAVLKIDSPNPLPAVTIANSDLLRVGDVVFAIGNPLEVGMTATMGIVSATGRTSLGILGSGGYEDFIQTDAAINLGNSGGALVDARGRLIGINTAIFSRFGGNIGIGFAIPANMVVQVMRNLLEVGSVPRGLLGLRPRNLDRNFAEAFGLENTQGALVDDVIKDSPAERAGVRHGDVITAVDERPIQSAEQLRLIISQTPPGTEVKLTIIRNNETLSIAVILGSLNGALASTEQPSPKSPLEGVDLITIDAEIRARHELPDNINGLLIKNIEANSPHARELQAGTVIIEVNGKSVNDRESFSLSLRSGLNHFYVWLNGNFTFVVVRISQ
jgi:Do/DeqQ family serine protease